jgi:hypothetical protein
MSTCVCGAELDQMALSCRACGRKFTLDANQTGDVEATRRIDWDAEFDKLARGELRPARAEVVPDVRRPWWRRWGGRSRR